MFDLGIGRTFQLTRLFMRLTVLENLLVATQRDEGWLRAVLRRAGSASEKRRAIELLDFVGIARLAHEPAGNLSYGQRKLLELASLLVADPAVLLLDEPAGGVNPTLIGHLADRIAELNRGGKTILVVEHNMEFVMNLCSRVTVLSQGTALVSGTPAEVRTNPAVLDAYLGGEDDASTQQELAAEAARPRVRGHRAGARRTTPPRTTPPRTTPPRTTAPEPVDGPAPLLRIHGVTAGYGGGDILKEVSVDVPARQHHVRGRAQRRRQVDAAGHDQRPPAAPRRGRSSSTARRSRARRPSRSSAAGSRRSPRPTACSPR